MISLSLSSPAPRLGGALALAAATFITCTSAPQGAWSQPVDDQAVVRIDTGALRGIINNRYRAFLGIPFAQPPVGALRWKAPQRPAAWQGERDATRMGMACPQPITTLAVTIREYAEDCLYLNVYTPASVRVGEALPVVFWIHGGANTTGSASEYDGAALAEVGRVIVVTTNYRMGMLGFLATPELQREDRRMNYGLQDQQAGLHWVQRNIARFGGDPARVTIAGQSAGGQSVMIHMASPLTKGLMHRAIVQGAAPTGLFNTPFTLEQAFVNSEQYVRAAGCADVPDRLACLRAKPMDTLLHALPYSMDFRRPGAVIGPLLDGELFPKPVFEAFKAGQFARVPLMIGMTRDELQALVALSYQIPHGKPPTEEEYQTSLTALGTPQAAASLLTSFYPSARYGSPQNALSALMSDFLFICPNHRATKVLARQVPTYAYRFDDRDAPSFLPVSGLNMLAYHGAEVQYVLPMWVDKPLTSAQQQMATRMKQYWANFAATGNPNRSSAPAAPTLPDWPRFDGFSGTYKSFIPGPGTEKLSFGTLPRQHQCLLWDVIESAMPSPTAERQL